MVFHGLKVAHIFVHPQEVSQICAENAGSQTYAALLWKKETLGARWLALVRATCGWRYV